MLPLILLFLALALLVCALVLTVYRQAMNRAWEKRRNQYHDRV
jgi:glucose uptake protein GlcU